MFDVKILKYWIDVEANTPPDILVGQHYMKEKNVYNQLVTKYTEFMNWTIKPEMKHQVYLGIVPVSNILSKMKNTQVEVEEDYHSCLVSFEVDNNGYPIIQTLKIPQYIVSMVQEHFGESFEAWKESDLYKHIKEQFAQWIAILKERGDGLNAKDLYMFLDNLKRFMNIWEWDVKTSDLAYIESVKQSFRFPSDYLDSFILSDLLMVKDSFEKSARYNKSAAEMYLRYDFKGKKKNDVSDNIENIKTALTPQNLNYAAWPDSGGFPLVTAQQVALNILFNYYFKLGATGVFSVNGPPGTGKTTLIQSIVANALFLRATEIFKLNISGKGAFNPVKTIRLDGEEIVVYEPVKELQGFEMIITSANNNAVKNITEELPLSGGLHPKSLGGFDYFKDVSDELLGFDTWGLIATSLGNNTNNEKVIDAFYNQTSNLREEIFSLGEDEGKTAMDDFKYKVSELRWLFNKYEKNDFNEEELKVFEDTIPNDEFWSSGLENIHLSSPWNNKTINVKKGQMFVESLRLHKKLIAENKSIFLNNLKVMKLILEGKIKDKEVINASWKTYFMICPVVSTTFSSLSKVFKGVNEGSFGFMFVDEAGQAKPQDLIGGLWRTKIACVIGDPLQVTPVNNITMDLNEYFKEKNRVPMAWDVLENSAQVIADRVNPYGGTIELEDQTFWVGSPLRVHRRCHNPMFDISNKIAYGGKMIHAKAGGSDLGEIANLLGPSKWFDIKSEDKDFEGYWVKSQYEFLKLKLAYVMEEKSTRGLPSIYVISPYKEVALKTIQMLMVERDSWIPSDYNIDDRTLSNWLYTSIGTIHTFQGKEAEVVFILLGGNPKKDVSWAVNSANIINVAATRAKNAQYFIGDRELWNVGVIKDVLEILDEFE